MKLLRCIYPLTGRIIVEEINPPFVRVKPSPTRPEKKRIEIYNVNGDLVSITSDRAQLKKLKLQEGFYLLREKDMNGRIISSGKLVF
jgi:hypothetical protein